MSLLLLIPLASVGGMAVPTRFAVNAQLRNVVGGPVSASAASFIVGAVALSVAAVFVSRSLPQMNEIASAPWWVWTGGLLGAAATVGFFLAGQMAASVAIDHFGLLGVATNEVTPPRVLGLLLVLAGVFLMQRF